MKITRYDSDTLFAATEGEWGELLANSHTNTIFLTWQWLSSWWSVYNPGHIWTLAVRDDRGRLHGLAPWFLKTDEDGTRTLYPIGCVDVTDYVDIIVRRGSEQSVFDLLTDYLAEHAGEFDRLRICNIPEESPTCEIWPRLLEARGFSVSLAVEDVCPVIVLPSTWPEYVASLDKKNRHELRRKLRRAAGLVDWYIVGKAHDLDEELERFLRLMAASSEEKAAFLDDPHNRQFFKKVMPVLARCGWLQLAFLTVDGVAAASYINFEYGSRVMVYNSGHEPETHGHLSPGILLLARLIQHAIEQGREVFDFLRGDEPYKYDLGGKDTRVYRLELGRAG